MQVRHVWGRQVHLTTEGTIMCCGLRTVVRDIWTSVNNVSVEFVPAWRLPALLSNLKGIYPEFQVIRGFSPKIPAVVTIKSIAN